MYETKARLVGSKARASAPTENQNLHERISELFALLSMKFSRWVIVICLYLCSVGCGKETQVVEGRSTASGTVTFDGKPLPGGTIAFSSTKGAVDTAVKIRDGAYFTDRAPVGSNKVTIDTSSIQLGNPAKYVPIPAKYNNPATSGLTAEIKPGENENVNFVLEK